MVLVASHDHGLDHGQQVVPEVQHEAGQHRQRAVARLAQPAFDLYAEHLGLILGLAPVEPVANQLIPLAAVWTAGRAQKDNPCELGQDSRHAASCWTNSSRC